MTVAACAMPARVESMVVDQEPAAGPASGGGPAIGVVLVEGGRETMPLFNSEVSDDSFARALKRSLAENRLWVEDASRARYALHARLDRKDRPQRGLSKTAESSIRYALRDLKSGQTVFETRVTTEHTVTAGDAFVAASRERGANEGAMRKNFAELIARLRGFRPRTS